MYVCQHSGSTPNPSCEETEKYRGYRTTQGWRAQIEGKKKKRGVLLFHRDSSKWINWKNELSKTLNIFNLSHLRWWIIFLILALYYLTPISVLLVVFLHSDYMFPVFFLHPSILSHMHISPDTVNSFYTVWNTHGAANKHTLIYGHTHTVCTIACTQTHTHANATRLCSLPQCADMIIKQGT